MADGVTILLLTLTTLLVVKIMKNIRGDGELIIK